MLPHILPRTHEQMMQNKKAKIAYLNKLLGVHITLTPTKDGDGFVLTFPPEFAPLGEQNCIKPFYSVLFLGRFVKLVVL